MNYKLKINDYFEIVKNHNARNRIVMPPMDTMMAPNSLVNDFHIQHYGSRAYGGVGTIIVETTAVLENGRITSGDLGIWKDSQIEGLSKLASIIKQGGAVAGIQLTHAGAKSELKNIVMYGTSNRFFKHLDHSKLKLIDDKMLVKIEDAFVESAMRAKKAGFDFVELHGAHGYLLSCIMSRLANDINKTNDIVKRSQLVINIIRRIHDEVKIPVGIRISFNDHLDDGMHVSEYEPLVKALDKYVDYFNVSSGHTIVSDSKSYLRIAKIFKISVKRALEMSVKYVPSRFKLTRVPLAIQVKKWTTKNVIVVGNFYKRKDIYYALHRSIDAIAMGRELLLNPNVIIDKILKPKEVIDSKYFSVKNPWFTYRTYRKWKNK